jgi:hypothetical protein
MFMEVAHYAYLVLKMRGPHNIISIRGDIKRTFICDRESCETIDRLVASTELQEIKQALVKSPPDPRPSHALGQDFQDIHPVGRHTQQGNCVVHGGTFQGGSRGQQLGSQIGTHARQIHPRKLGHLCMEAC